MREDKLFHEIYSNANIAETPMSMPSKTAKTVQPYDSFSFDLHMSCYLTFLDASPSFSRHCSYPYLLYR